MSAAPSLATVALATALAACSFSRAVDGDAPGTVDAPDAARTDWLPGFHARKPIDLAGGTTALADFVSAITEAADPDLANRDELAFTAADGVTRLAAERVTYDRASGGFEAWVRQSLTAGAPTRIYVYFDGTASGAAPTEVWSPAIFAGVWHMTGTVGTPDSTAAQHDAVVADSAPASAPGLVGLARAYDGATQVLDVPDPADGSLDFGTRSFAYGVWVNVTSSAGGFDVPLGKGAHDSGTAGYDLELGTANWNLTLSDGQGGNAFFKTLETEAAGLGSWQHLAVVVDRSDSTASQVRGYVNGAVAVTSAFDLQSLDSDLPLYLGDTKYRFKGLLDEVRIYNGLVTDAWLAAEHANLADRAHFVTIGATQHY